MKIIEVKNNRKQYLNLLLLADEQEDMIDKYINKGWMFILQDTDVICECIVTDEGNGILEIKSLATRIDKQRNGYAKAMLKFVENKFKDRFSILQVGTGDSPLTIPFYEKCGFVKSHIIPDFFTTNYNHPIIEEGIKLKDMIVLRKMI